MGKRRARRRIENAASRAADARELAERQAIGRALAELPVGARIAAVEVALKSAFFGQNLNAALYRMREKPKTLGDAREVVLGVLRACYACDTTDVVLKMHVERGATEDGKPFENLTVTSVFAHPSLLLPIVERVKAARAA